MLHLPLLDIVCPPLFLKRGEPNAWKFQKKGGNLKKKFWGGGNQKEEGNILKNKGGTQSFKFNLGIEKNKNGDFQKHDKVYNGPRVVESISAIWK